jgi:DNA-binding XRE family transcriptional regulator
MKINLVNAYEFRKMLLVNGYSQRSLAKKIQISNPYLNQIIHGERCPSAKVAKKIVDELGIKFEDIFFIDVACKSEQN